MTIAAFLATYLHRTVTAPGGIGGECVDVANQYLHTVFAAQPVRANAVDWATASVPNATWTRNLPANSPLSGSLLVFGPAPSVGIGANGHIALVVVSDAMHVVSADQNWGGQRTLEIVVHPYTGVLGWWYPDALALW